MAGPDKYDKETILSRVDIVELFQSHGTVLHKNGKDYKGLCPFHADKNPSLSVNREKQVWHCFGCGASGDMITFVRKVKQLDFHQALEYLAGYSGSSTVIAADKAAAKPRRRRLLLKTEDILNHYRKTLATSREAVQYLESRGITDKGLYTRLQLGYADGSLPGMLSSRQTEDARTLGYLRADGREHFHGCITFPIFDGNSRLVHMYGRRINETRPQHLYLPGSHHSVFSRQASRVYAVPPGVRAL